MTPSIPTDVQLFNFVDDLEASLGFDPGSRYDCDNIILCGVGGSAVSSDFATDCCLVDSVKPIRLIKYPDLPSWASDRTLAVISSYSGNTAETLEMYRQAKSKGCAVVAITSGGALKEEAVRGGDELVMLPEGMHPRHAIGYMIGYTLAVIHAAGGPDLSDAIRGFIPSLRRYRDGTVLGDGGLASDLAREYLGSVPVICSDSSMRSVAFRWKTQINENSKYVAFCDSEPTFSINDLRAWASSDHGECVLTFLVGCDDRMCVGTGTMESAIRELQSSGVRMRVIRLGGSSTLENMFRAIILGDYVSVDMANLRGMDPAEVRPVMLMKEKLAGRRH